MFYNNKNNLVSIISHTVDVFSFNYYGLFEPEIQLTIKCKHFSTFTHKSFCFGGHLFSLVRCSLY